MLTVRNTERDKVQALDAGADDYVVKPFGVRGTDGAHSRCAAPLCAGRIRAAVRLRRLENRFRKARGPRKGKPVRLTPKEFELLRQLVANQGKAIAHRRLLQAVWGPDYGEETEYLRVFINQLRKKIEPDPQQSPLHPHRTLGRLPVRAPPRASPRGQRHGKGRVEAVPFHRHSADENGLRSPGVPPALLRCQVFGSWGLHSW